MSEERGYMPISKSTEHGTPQTIFGPLDAEFHFTLDVCASPENAKCAPNCRKKRCAKRGWHTAEYIPGIVDWARKANIESRDQGTTVVMLLPARTESTWFHAYIWDKATGLVRPRVELRFVKGRVKFEGAKDVAPFPSMVVIFRPRAKVGEAR